MVLGAHMALWGTFSSALNKFMLQEVNLKIGHNSFYQLNKNWSNFYQFALIWSKNSNSYQFCIRSVFLGKRWTVKNLTDCPPTKRWKKNLWRNEPELSSSFEFQAQTSLELFKIGKCKVFFRNVEQKMWNCVCFFCALKKVWSSFP